MVGGRLGHVRAWLRLTSEPWMSASVFSFIVAALVTYVITIGSKPRPAAVAA